MGEDLEVRAVHGPVVGVPVPLGEQALVAGIEARHLRVVAANALTASMSSQSESVTTSTSSPTGRCMTITPRLPGVLR